jgi:ADP-ribosylglycohydrolase
MPDERRYSGSLIGQCLGDALGFVVEGEPPKSAENTWREP